MARNPVGARLQVYVDPDHPRQAVVEKGLAGGAKQYGIPFIVGGIFLALGLFLWFLAPHLAGPRRSRSRGAIRFRPDYLEANGGLIVVRELNDADVAAVTATIRQQAC